MLEPIREQVLWLPAKDAECLKSNIYAMVFLAYLYGASLLFQCVTSAPNAASFSVDCVQPIYVIYKQLLKLAHDDGSMAGNSNILKLMDFPLYAASSFRE